MKLTLKTIIASVALALASTAALAEEFTLKLPENASQAQETDTASAAIERLEDIILKRNHNLRIAEAEDWFRRIVLSGEINIDAATSNRTQRQNVSLNTLFIEQVTGVPLDGDITAQLNNIASRWSGSSSSDMAVADANLYLMARITNWVRTNLDILFADDKSIYGFVNQDHSAKGFNVNEAYITVGNFAQSPVYFRAGREYVPFGYYERHPITVPFTHLMTQTNATALQLGFVDDSGLNGAIFVFRNKVPKADSAGASPPEPKRRIENGGLQIGFRHEQADAGFSLDASWLANMADVDYLSSSIFDNVTATSTNIRVGNISSLGSIYERSVAAYSLAVQGHIQGFDAAAQYVSAGRRFTVADMKRSRTDTIRGARPSAWIAGVGYSFPVFAGYASHIGINYQRSREALYFGDGFGLAGVPRARWQADYYIDLMKNFRIGIEYVNDRDYPTSKGGTGKRSSTGIIRLSTRFS